MISRYFTYLLVLLCFKAFSQKDTIKLNKSKFLNEYGKQLISKICISQDYHNNLLIRGQSGKLFLVDSTQQEKIVYVSWANGYSSVGELKFNKPYGIWLVYDRRNRLRKRMEFLDERTLLYIQKFDKHGRMIYSSWNDAPF